jgi:hypothetical protein
MGGALGAKRDHPQQFAIRLHMGADDEFGASLGEVPTGGAVLYCAQEGGVLDRWNKENPDKAVRPGFTIVEVNGITSYWRLVEELRRGGALDVKISTVLPKLAGPFWFEDIAAMSRKIELSKERDSFMTRLPSQTSQEEKLFSTLPRVIACTAGFDQWPFASRCLQI